MVQFVARIWVSVFRNFGADLFIANLVLIGHVFEDGFYMKVVGDGISFPTTLSLLKSD